MRTSRTFASRAASLALLAVVVAPLAACSRPEPVGTTQTTSGVVSTLPNGDVPVPVEALHADGVAAYDAAIAGDWARASSLVAAVARARDDAESALGGRADAMQRVGLDRAVDQLRAAVDARDVDRAAGYANTIAYYASNLALPYRSAVPVDVRRLEYYARALHLAAARGDADAVRAIGDDAARTWNGVRADALAHGATNVASAMDGVVSRLATVRPRDADPIATSMRDDARDLESIYLPLPSR